MVAKLSSAAPPPHFKKSSLCGFSLVAHSSSSDVEAKALASEAAKSPGDDLARAPVSTSRRELGSSALSLSGECLDLENPLAFPSGLAWPSISHL